MNETIWCLVFWRNKLNPFLKIVYLATIYIGFQNLVCAVETWKRCLWITCTGTNTKISICLHMLISIIFFPIFYVSFIIFSEILLLMLSDYVFQNQGILQSQGRILSKMRFMPSSLSSNSHRLLTALVDSRHKKVYKVKNCITDIDPEREKEEKERVSAADLPIICDMFLTLHV